MPISQNSYYIELWEMFISQDNQESLSIIYKDHFDLLYNFGFKYTSDTGAIENSIQNIFGYFLKKRNKLGPVNNMSGYLIQCFRNELYLALKKQKKMGKKQKTIQKEISLTGVGLHTGVTVNMTFKPAPANHGFAFVRMDLEGTPTVEAKAEYVVNTQRGTNLKKNGVEIQTSEHVLAAAVGLDIENHKDKSKKIIFKKTDALTFISKTNITFDLILIK